MRTINTKATVMADGMLIMQLPPDVSPGEHQIVLVIDEQPIQQADRLPLKFSAYPVGLASEDFTARREDLYRDEP
jgi:hypothetical protein